MIVDAFPFYNELDLLELRLNELFEVVDYFVLAEAPYTHSGKPKPLYYRENRDRFRDFWSKILAISVDDIPMTPGELAAAITPQDRQWLATGYQLGDNWVRERFQRNALMGVLDDFYPEDIIIIEDADEMLRAEVVGHLPGIVVDGSNAVEQVFHTYYLNWECTNMPWWGSKVLKRRFVSNPSEHRFHTPAANFIRNGGWHFNYLGGVAAIQDKIKAFAHDEFNTPKVLGEIEPLLECQKDAIGRLYQYKTVEIDESYPRYVRDHIEKYDQMGWIDHVHRS